MQTLQFFCVSLRSVLHKKTSVLARFIKALDFFRIIQMFFKKNKNNSEPENTNTIKAVFWGASDRMICCKGIDCDTNEFNNTSEENLNEIGYIGTLEIKTPNSDDGIFIHAFYSGQWSFAISPSDEENDELPNWKITREWGSINSHSETVTIECPPDSRVDLIKPIGTEI